MPTSVRISLFASLVSGLALVAVALGGCLQDDPNHCSNRGGAQACANAGLGDHCSLCIATNFGCRADPDPDPECRVESPEPETSSTDPDEAAPDSAGPEDEPDDSEQPAAGCSADGYDPACPPTAPYCVDGQCAGCGTAAAALCVSVDPDVPHCVASLGLCGQCRDDGDCGDGTPYCDPSTASCRGCAEHDECPATACDLSTGACMDVARTFYVDPAACPRTGFGTEDDPYCALEDAVEQLRAGDTMFLAGGNEPFAFERRLPNNIAILGIAQPRIELGLDAIADGSTVLIAGADVQGNGLRCQGGALFLDDARVDDPGGLAADDCTIAVRRTVVTGAAGPAIRMHGGVLTLESSVLAGNGRNDWPAAALELQAVQATVAYSTLAGNKVQPGNSSALTCDLESEVRVRGSVLVGERLDAVDCPSIAIEDSVVDTMELAGSGNIVVPTYEARWWANIDAGDAHVEPQLDSPMPEVVHWRSGDPVFDLDGDAIAPFAGKLHHAGADQT